MNTHSQDAQDQHLLKLAIAVKTAFDPKSPKTSQEQQRAINRFAKAVLASGRLCRPHKSRFFDRYNEIYEEAKQDVWLRICKEIHNYNPERASVMCWINFLLSKQMIDTSRKILGKLPLNREDISTLSDSELSNTQSDTGTTPALSDLLRECLEADRDGLFQQIHVKGCPAATFQAIVLLRLDDMDWSEISAEFGVSVSTLSSFFRRSLKRFKASICSDIW